MAAMTLPLIFCAFSMNSDKPGQDDFQNTAQFAGFDHVDKQAVEDFRVLGQRFGERAAAFDRQRQLANDGFQVGIPLLFFEHAQAAQQRQAGIHERGQLAGESGNTLGLTLPPKPGILMLRFMNPPFSCRRFGRPAGLSCPSFP